MVNRKLFPEKSAKELLVQFRESGSQEPFEEIVRRYAAMVYGVCLRVTGDKHDAEDATQAVFLSLALQAKTSREITYVGPWLQKVAHRLALDVKKAKTRRKRREDKLAEQARHLANGNGHANGHSTNGNGNGNGHGNGFFGGNGHVNPADVPGAEELKAIMMEELNKLPAKYRMPLVLHFFGGLSREEMAAELGCNPSTLGVRVHRGKALLGTRLKKRGVGISAIAMTVLLEHVIRSTTVHPLISASATASSAAGLVAGSNAHIFGVSARVIALTRTVAKSIVYAKLKVALAVLLVIASAAVTTGSVVARYVDVKNLHLPSLRLGDWIRPLLRSFVSSPQANATDPKSADLAADAEQSLAVSPHQPLNVTVDLDKLGVGSSSPLVAARPAPATPAVSRLTLIEHAPDPQPNEVAQAILAPTLSVPPSSTSKVEEVRSFARGADELTITARPEPAPSSDDSAGDGSQDAVVTASADGAGNLNIGAGGGGGFGKPETYVLPPNTTLRTNNLTVGDSGAALFHQLGGTNQVAGTLTVAKQKTSTATYQLDDGTVSARHEVIGDAGDGVFVMANGVNLVEKSITVGKSAGGRGSYRQSGGTTVVKNPAGEESGGLHIADAKGSTGTYVLSDGTLSATPQIIGGSGTAAFEQTGGTNTSGAIAIAKDQGSVGQYTLTDGGLVLDSTAAGSRPHEAISIGGEGRGTFDLGNAVKTGAVYEVGRGSSVVVRGQSNGAGYLRGYGKFDLTGVLVNNGQITADGWHDERSLDLSSFAWVTATIENPRFMGTNGFFARRKGRLALPPLHFAAGTSTDTWGEDNSDPLIDMVNSVRVTVHDAAEDGLVRIALLSTLRNDIPALPDGHKFIGLWSFDGSDLRDFDAVDLSVRYDDGAAATLGLDEEMLKLWEYDSSLRSWQRLDGDPDFIRDTFDHILSGRANGDLTYFAVSAPEPTAVTLLLLTTGATVLRRRRRRN